jgi:hypothetical protein
MATDREDPQDTVQRDILVDFFADANYQWHARLLLVRIDGQASRVVAAPGDGNATLNLATHREWMHFAPRARDAAQPARVAGQCYLFDPVTEAELRAMLMGTTALARVVGTAGAPVPETARDYVWLVADTSKETFGTEVPAVHLENPDNLLYESSVGICCIATVWTHVERVLRTDLDQWKASKRRGPGYAPSPSGDERNGHGRRFTDLTTAMAELRSDPRSDWVFSGPRACVEVLDGIAATRHSILEFQDFWITASGCIPGSPSAHYHRNLLSVLFLALDVGQLNCYNLMWIEMVCRLIRQLDKAVRRSPGNPNFGGLPVLTAFRLDQQGGALVDVFATYVAGLQENDAVTFWQQQLFAWKVANEMRKEVGHEDGGTSSSGGDMDESGDRSFPSNSGEGSR